MAVKIRLRLQGRTNRQTFRLVATDVRRPRGGKYLEMLGSYNPFQAENNFIVNADRLNYWLGQGAELTENAEKLLGKVAPDVIKGLHAKQQARRLKKVAKRKSLKKKG
jgi:small subunit ribosomal protein S16